MRALHKFNLTAVLLSATVISTPSPASTLPQTLSEHRDLSAPISLPVTDGGKLPQLEHRDLSAPISLELTERIKRRPFAPRALWSLRGKNCA